MRAPPRFLGRIPKRSCGGMHPCLPWSRGFQPGGKKRLRNRRAQNHPNPHRHFCVQSGRQRCRLHTRQGCLTPPGFGIRVSPGLVCSLDGFMGVPPWAFASPQASRKPEVEEFCLTPLRISWCKNRIDLRRFVRIMEPSAFPDGESSRLERSVTTPNQPNQARL
jgi:hypothetical protein